MWGVCGVCVSLPEPLWAHVGLREACESVGRACDSLTLVKYVRTWLMWKVCGEFVGLPGAMCAYLDLCGSTCRCPYNRARFGWPPMLKIVIEKPGSAQRSASAAAGDFADFRSDPTCTRASRRPNSLKLVLLSF